MKLNSLTDFIIESRQEEIKQDIENGVHLYFNKFKEGKVRTTNNIGLLHSELEYNRCFANAVDIASLNNDCYVVIGFAKIGNEIFSHYWNFSRPDKTMIDLTPTKQKIEKYYPISALLYKDFKRLRYYVNQTADQKKLIKTIGNNFADQYLPIAEYILKLDPKNKTFFDNQEVHNILSK